MNEPLCSSTTGAASGGPPEESLEMDAEKERMKAAERAALKAEKDDFLIRTKKKTKRKKLKQSIYP